MLGIQKKKSLQFTQMSGVTSMRKGNVFKLESHQLKRVTLLNMTKGSLSKHLPSVTNTEQCNLVKKTEETKFHRTYPPWMHVNERYLQ